MKVKLITLGIILSFIISSMPITGITLVAGAKDEQQQSQEQKVLDPEFEKYLSTLNPTDNITVIVRLKNDPKVDQQIQALYEGQPDDEAHIIAERLKEKYKKLSIAVGPFEDQLQAGDPAAVEKFNKLVIEYGLTANELKADNERLAQLRAAKDKEVTSLLDQAYSEMQNEIRSRVEQLPDTAVIDSYYMPNTVVVKTRVSNIETIAALPEVIDIFQGARGVEAISPYYGPIPLSPDNGSIDCPVYGIPFLWTPFKEATQYRFALARDSAMTQMVKEIQVATTSYIYDGTLDYGTNYFWRVMALEPAPSDWSQTFNFQTEAAPTPVPPEAPLQPTPWPPILVAGLVITLTAAIGIILWFLVTRSRRGKMKTSE
jgi:hypothetical protein